MWCEKKAMESQKPKNEPLIYHKSFHDDRFFVFRVKRSAGRVDRDQDDSAERGLGDTTVPLRLKVQGHHQALVHGVSVEQRIWPRQRAEIRMTVQRGASVMEPYHCDSKYRDTVKHWCRGYLWNSAYGLSKGQRVSDSLHGLSVPDAMVASVAGGNDSGFDTHTLISDSGRGVFAVILIELEGKDQGWHCVLLVMSRSLYIQQPMEPITRY
ncbi:uncharacterized protein LOC125739865 [Brienomyrus brachyistius]|uniref:uncharacterized protein LOC125739865 n=1 Tax=Brienomyrus brachyistius TaxID=42636 RepID=UPI0020B3BD25|nr:uncharacterized protein LOC125739865 [Brienomyrus brachyistius]